LATAALVRLSGAGSFRLLASAPKTSFVFHPVVQVFAKSMCAPLPSLFW
jgi:hypothetical protein